MSIEGAAGVTERGGLGIEVVWHEDCLLHWPGGEVWLGVRDTGTEPRAKATV